MQGHGESGLDRIVYDQFFANSPPGVFVDVGAARPDFLSMSALYRELGWRVIAVEPNPVFAEAQRQSGVEVLEYACADRDEDAVDFELVDLHGAVYEDGSVSYESYSSLGAKPAYQAERDQLDVPLDVSQITVDVRRLDTLLAEHAPELESVQIVSVDVEGWELEVIAGFSLERYKPAVVIVENLFDDPTYQGVLLKRGYRRWRHIKPNDVYVPERVSAVQRTNGGDQTRSGSRVGARHGDETAELDSSDRPHTLDGVAVPISYSQNAEDIRLWRIFGGLDNGFFVDIGAADPSTGSVSRLFYEHGWSGVNVEPSPAFDALRAERERDINLHLAVGETEGLSPFFVTYPDLGLSSGDVSNYAQTSEAIERTELVTVSKLRLESILRDYAAGPTIQFLKVAVGGAEREVLASSEWSTFRPVVVLVRDVRASHAAPTHEAWEHILLDADYEFAVFDGINRFYVDRDHRELIPALAYPISPLDSFVTATAHELSVTAEERRSEVERLDRALEQSRAEFTEKWHQAEQLGESLRQVRAELWETRHQSEELDQSLEQSRAELEQAQSELEQAHADLGQAHVDLGQVHADLGQAHVDLGQAHADLVDAQAERGQAWHQLGTVYRSRPWRIGMVIAGAVRPAVRLARVMRRLLRREEPTASRGEAPARPYAACVEPGRPWYFSHESVARGAAASPLNDILDEFGSLHESVDASRASALAAAVSAVGWTDDESLLERHQSWDERQAIVETDAVVRLVKARQNGNRRLLSTRRAVVVDARCLQDPHYGRRGVGRHGRGVLQATRMAAGGHDLILLTSADLPALDDELTQIADDVVVTPYALRTTDVRLFVQLSPMTASLAPTVPFLACPTCATASVVHDFIPAQFPDAYLHSAGSVLVNRARSEALRHYDLLLSNSRSTAAACVRILGSVPEISVTGVGDPLDGVRETAPAVDGPYMLVSSGGDPRKNTPVALAALAQHRRNALDGDSRRRGRKNRPGLLRAIVTGTLAPEHTSALIDLAAALGLPEDAVELRGYVGDDELLGLYRAADLAFVPSFVEGFSIPVAEAALRGTPVVASDIAAHRELIGAGPWLAPPSDVNGLAGAIDHVRAHRAAVAEEQGSVITDIADPASVVSRIAGALEPLLARGRTPDARPLPSPTRPRVGVISPFPPQKSGVADFTAYTFRQVAHYADVDVYTSASPDLYGPLRIHRLSSAPYIDRRLDAVVNVVGNSHFHFPILDFMGSYGGAAISHDNRMVESYLYDRGAAWTAALLSRNGQAVRPEEIGDFLLNLDRLPAVGYDLIARQASPLIVHGPGLAERIFAETGIRPEIVPFVPYNVPEVETIDAAARERCRRLLGLRDDVVHVATFGIPDSRTKGTDLIVGALSWLHSWGRPAHLHVVGELPQEEGESLARLADQLEITPHMTFHGRVNGATLREFLLAVDLAVQLRMSAVLSLSGALADCVAFGVPTVTTQEVADEMGAPAYVVTTGSATSSLLIAEAIEGLCEQRRREVAAIEAERRAYLETHSVDAYARGLLAALGLWS